MDKLYFKTRKEEIQSKIDSCKKEMKELENEYIVSNQKFPIGSKVCLTIPAHTERLYWGKETKTIPEEKKFAYVTGYEIVIDEVIPILMKAKKDGTISKLREYMSFRQAIIELAE
mgnify:CR=1 FL=1